MRKQAGFVARGALATIILAVLGIALLSDTITGKATDSDYATFGAILLLSALATLVFHALRRKRDETH